MCVYLILSYDISRWFLFGDLIMYTTKWNKFNNSYVYKVLLPESNKFAEIEHIFKCIQIDIWYLLPSAFDDYIDLFYNIIKLKILNDHLKLDSRNNH